VKGNFHGAVEVDLKINIAGFAVHLWFDASQRGRPGLGAATQRAQEMSLEFEQAEARSDETGFEHGATWKTPYVGKLVRSQLTRRHVVCTADQVRDRCGNLRGDTLRKKLVRRRFQPPFAARDEFYATESRR
jgi:hypothetical protein